MKPPKFFRKFNYDKSLLPNKYLASMERGVSTIEEAKANTGLSIGFPGWCLIYYALLSHLTPEENNVIVETGTNQGWTTIILAQALRDSNSRGKIYTVELDQENYKNALANFHQAGVADLIKAINGDSKAVLNEIVNKPDLIRAAFLDASHLFDDVIAEFEIILPALGPQSLVIFDNTYAIAEEHEDQRVNGALKAILKRHGGNLVNLEFVSWYTPGIAIWQKSPFDSLKTMGANNKSKHNSNAKKQRSDRKKTQNDMIRHSQEELKLWEISQQLFSMVAYSDFKRALEGIALIEKQIVGRHCGDLGDKLSQYLTIIQFFRESGVNSADSLEIGTLFGGSCLLKLMAMRDLNVKGKIICIDPMEGYYGNNVDPYSGIEVTADILFNNLDIFGIPRKSVELRRMPSNDNKATAGLIESSFATLMIDGDHSYQGVLYDWEKYNDFVKEGGFVLLDDYAEPAWPDITKFVNKLSCSLPHGWNPIGQIGTTFLIKKNNLTEPALLNQQGEELFREGDLPGALNLFTKVTQTDPNFSLAHNNLGVVYWQTQRREEAVKHFVRALEIDPSYYNNASNCYQAYNALATRTRTDQNSKYPFLLARLAGGIMKFHLPGIDPSEQIKWLNGFKSILISLEIKLKNQIVNDLDPSEQYFLSAFRYCICSIYLQINILNEQGISLLRDFHSSLVRMGLWQLGCLDQFDIELLEKIMQATNSVKGTLVKYEEYFACFALMLFDKPSKIALTINSDAVYLTYLNYLKHKIPQQTNNVYCSRVLSNLGLPVERALWYVENYADISKFKDKHNGESCYIIGNGPSLRKMDLSALRHRVTFGLNKIYLLFDKLGFGTTYLAAANPYVIQQAAKDFSSLSMPMFIMMWGREFIQKKEKVIFLRENSHPLFAKDITKGVCIDATVTYMAMQIAYYMGFKTVILIGVDHFFKSKGQPHSTVQLSGEDPNHFDPNYFGYGVPWQLPDLAGSERAYQRAKKVFEADGRRILDATLEGKLQIFEKISYSAALDLTG